MCEQSHIPYYTAFGVSTVPHSTLYSVCCVNNPTFQNIERFLCEQSNIPYYTAVAVSTIPCQDYFRAPTAITANQETAVQPCGTGMYRITIIIEVSKAPTLQIKALISTSVKEHT